MNISRYFLMVSILCIGTLNAQTSDEGTSAGIEEVVVTAQKREGTLQETPIAITAVTSDEINYKNVNTIMDIGNIAPNAVFVRTPSNNTAATIAIRGGVQTNPAITWEPAVGVYLDGVYMGKTQGAIFDAIDLERVEVLRGPQGTLYGRNTLAGAINMISAKPTETSTKAKLSMGNYGLTQLQFVSNIVLDDNWSFKIVASDKNRDGYVNVSASPFTPAGGVVGSQPNQVTELDTLDSQATRFSVIYDAEAFSVNVTADKNEQNNTPQMAQLGYVIPGWSDVFQVGNIGNGLYLWPLERIATRDGKKTDISIDAPVHERSTIEGLSVTVDIPTRLGNLKIIQASREMVWADRLDLDGSPFPVAETARDTDYDSDTIELQLTGTTDGGVNYVLGYYKIDEYAFTDNPQSFFGGGNLFGPNDYVGYTDATAIFGQLDFPLTEKLTFTLGGRKTQEDKSGVRRTQLTAQGFPLPLIVATGSDSFDDFSQTVVLDYELNDSTNVYLKVADGFKAGGFNSEFNVYSQGTDWSPYSPEKIESVELGMKGLFADNRLLLNLAYFDNEHKDMQTPYFTADGAASSLVINTQAEMSGLDVEMKALITDNTSLTVNYGYLDGEMEPAPTADGGIASNLMYAPDDTLYVSLEHDFGNYRLILDHHRIGAHHIFPYQSVDLRSRLTDVDERSTTDMRLVFDNDEKFNVVFWIKNMNDKEYIVNNINFGASFGHLTVDYFNPPRTVGFDLTYNF